MAEVEAYPIPEFLPLIHHADAVSGLRRALMAVRRPLTWRSLDGNTAYNAVPQENTDPSELWGLLHAEFEGRFYDWVLYRHYETPEPEDIKLDVALLRQDRPFSVTNCSIPRSLTPAEIVQIVNDEVRTQVELGINAPAIEDYAWVDNALFDLARRVENYEERD